jgi:hypothetical protein
MQIKKKTFAVLAMGIILVFSLHKIQDVYRFNHNGNLARINKDIQMEILNDDVFIHENEICLGIFSYYYPENNHYLWTPDGYIPYSNLKVFKHVELKNLSEADFINKRIWLIRGGLTHGQQIILQDIMTNRKRSVLWGPWIYDSAYETFPFNISLLSK